MEHLGTLVREMDINEHRGYSVTVVYEWKGLLTKILWWLHLIKPQIPTIELESPMTGEHQWCEMRGVPLPGFKGAKSQLVYKGAAYLRAGRYTLTLSTNKKTSKYFNASIFYGPLHS